jgi:hypothetical protein
MKINHSFQINFLLKMICDRFWFLPPQNSSPRSVGGGGESFLRENWFEMSDLFSSLLIFTIIKTILSIFFLTVSKFYKHLVKWALTEIEWSVAGTTTLDREWFTIICQNLKDVCIVFVYRRESIYRMELHLAS